MFKHQKIFVQFYSLETRTSKFYEKSVNDELKEILIKLTVGEGEESLVEGQTKAKGKGKIHKFKKILGLKKNVNNKEEAKLLKELNNIAMFSVVKFYGKLEIINGNKGSP
mgnify:CR=1 FL=1